MDGVHIVLDRASVVRMVSSTNGVPVNSPDGYDELVYSDVHISDSGEYVHAAPWSVNSQGRANVSHGCINLSPDNAQAFFAFSRVGDVVLVGGGPRPPAVGDHGVMDWDTVVERLRARERDPARARVAVAVAALTATSGRHPDEDLGALGAGGERGRAGVDEARRVAVGERARAFEIGGAVGDEHVHVVAARVRPRSRPAAADRPRARRRADES